MIRCRLYQFLARMTPIACLGAAKLVAMFDERCRDHPAAIDVEMCRECSEPCCPECLVAADGLVLPICRPCAASAPTVVRDLGTSEETMRFSPRTFDGWVVLHEPSR